MLSPQSFYEALGRQPYALDAAVLLDDRRPTFSLVSCEGLPMRSSHISRRPHFSLRTISPDTANKDEVLIFLQPAGANYAEKIVRNEFYTELLNEPPKVISRGVVGQPQLGRMLTGHLEGATVLKRNAAAELQRAIDLGESPAHVKRAAKALAKAAGVATIDAAFLKSL